MSSTQMGKAAMAAKYPNDRNFIAIIIHLRVDFAANIISKFTVNTVLPWNILRRASYVLLLLFRRRGVVNGTATEENFVPETEVSVFPDACGDRRGKRFGLY